MEIKRSGSQPSGKGPVEYFAGTVRVDPLFEAPVPARTLGASVTLEPGARVAHAMLREKGISYTVSGKSSVDLTDAVNQLGEHFEIRTLLLEGGGHINGAFLEADGSFTVRRKRELMLLPCNSIRTGLVISITIPVGVTRHCGARTPPSR